jgi:hypothetical protein
MLFFTLPFNFFLDLENEKAQNAANSRVSRSESDEYFIFGIQEERAGRLAA